MTPTCNYERTRCWLKDVLIAVLIMVRKEIFSGNILFQGQGEGQTIDNMVLSCQKCNLSKSDKDPYEWYGEERKYEISRIVLGKYLKLVYEAHETADTLDSADLNVEGKLNVLDVGVIFKKPSG